MELPDEGEVKSAGAREERRRGCRGESHMEADDSLGTPLRGRPERRSRNRRRRRS